MPAITVKDIPDQLYNRFKELAERDHRSLNAEVIVAMEQMIKQGQLQSVSGTSADYRAAKANSADRCRQRERSAGTIFIAGGVFQA